jgi:two-component system, OmpR family, alkaline phosphatase synthesis response regulator PhoP
MTETTILVVEDEEDIQELIVFNMKKEGCKVDRADSGSDAIRMAREIHPDLMILDLMLPGLNGLEVCQQIRDNKELADMPIIMVTAKGEESDIVAGLEMGADDYVTKPFSVKILLTRVKALLRRKNGGSLEEEGILRFPDLEINVGKHETLVCGQQIKLTHSEFAILHALALRPGWVFTRTQIVNAIRGDDYAVTDRSIDFQIVGLRKKLDTVSHYIETVRGVGYRFYE